MENNQNTAHCIACLESIRTGALVCPHCGSHQAGNRWKILGNILKWIGGITAIISLIAASIQINQLYLDWREKGVVIEELVRAAQFQQEASDYSNAWEFLNQALALEPTSRIARQQQVNLAMVWVKRIYTNDEQFIDTINKLIPVLYRGVASEDQHNAAMVSAHLGWAEFKRSRKGIKGLDIERHFKRSLSLDPENLFGNAMYGYWLLSSQNPDRQSKKSFEQATKHFQNALDSRENQEYVRSLQVEAYLDSFNLDANIKAYETALLLLNKGETFSQDNRERIADKLEYLVVNQVEGEPDSFTVKLYDALIDIFGPEQLLRVFLWAYPTHEMLKGTAWLYVQGSLTEASGDEKAAIFLYRELISQYPSRVNGLSNYARDHIRQIELKKNVCYVPMLVINYVTGDAQTAVKVLQSEDKLLSYNGDYIHNLDELDKAKENVDTDHQVKLVMLRDATPIFLEIKSGQLGISFDEEQVSERALGEYAIILCSRVQTP